MKSSTEIFSLTVSSNTLPEVIGIIDGWMTSKTTHMLVTLNVEMIMLAQKDAKFRSVLSSSDLLTCDSARLGWAATELEEKSLIKKLLYWPFFLYPKAPFLKQLPVVTGTDLVEKLFSASEAHHYSIGFLGSSKEILEKLVSRLAKSHPGLSVRFAESGVVVDANGISSQKLDITPVDILFVAFGHGKQEKWIAAHKNTYAIKLMIGVGGALDYVSGHVERAPYWVRNIGFEWLYRLIKQPWRWKRQLSLVEFVFLILTVSFKKFFHATS